MISEISPALRAIIYPHIFPQEQGSRATIPGSSSPISSLQTFLFFLTGTNITHTLQSLLTLSCPCQGDGSSSSWNSESRIPPPSPLAHPAAGAQLPWPGC